jgi:hypothetical protein
VSEINIFDDVEDSTDAIDWNIEDSGDHSAWAPILKAIRFLDLIGVDSEVPVQIGAMAEQIADELRAANPSLGGGRVPPRGESSLSPAGLQDRKRCR